MKSMLKSYSIRIMLVSLILALIMQLLFSFLPSIPFEKAYDIFSSFNIATLIIVICIAVSSLAMLYQNIYGNILEWLKYSPLYLAVSLLILAPGMPWQQYTISRLYTNMSGLLLAFCYMFVVFMQLIGGVLVFALFAVIITAVRENKTNKKKQKSAKKEKTRKKRRINLLKNGKYPLWFRFLYSFIDAVVMIIPFTGIISAAGMLIIKIIPMAPGLESLGPAILCMLVLILICVIMTLIYYYMRICYAVKIHKTYKSYLLCIPFYILAGAALYFGPEFEPIYYGQLFFWSTKPLKFLQPLIDLVGGDEKFLVILYVLEWFVAISLVFAVRYIIKRIKARKEGQESNPEMPGEAIHDAETRVCCEQNSTGEEVNLHNTVVEEAINAKQEHTN